MAMKEKLIFVMDEKMKCDLEKESHSTGKSQAEIVRDAVTDKFAKRIICVQHSGGRVEVDPSAK